MPESESNHNKKYEQTPEAEDLMRAMKAEANRRAMEQFHRRGETASPMDQGRFDRDFKAARPEGEVHHQAGIPLPTEKPKSEEEVKALFNKMIEIRADDKPGTAFKFNQEIIDYWEN